MTKISVITPCYNAASYIKRTIESVRNQTISDWEHIVVDDGSIDESATVIQSIVTTEPRVKLIQQPNKGRASACNTGFKNCSPDSNYLIFLDADDCLEPQMLEKLSQYLDLHPAVSVVSCDFKCIDSEDNILEKKKYNYLGPRYVPTFLSAHKLPSDEIETPFVSIFTLSCFLCTVSLIRRSVYELTPGWDEEFGFMYDDIDLFLHLSIRGKVHYISQELARYRRHNTQDTATTASLKEARLRQKLYDKWLDTSKLSVVEKEVVVEAYRFLRGNLQLYKGFHIGTENLKRRRHLLALRNYYGTAYFYCQYLANRLIGNI